VLSLSLAYVSFSTLYLRARTLALSFLNIASLYKISPTFPSPNLLKSSPLDYRFNHLRFIIIASSL
jgi:hypothetical protein